MYRSFVCVVVAVIGKGIKGSFFCDDVQTLEERDFMIICLLKMNGGRLNIIDIADILGVTKQAVSLHYVSACKKLKKRIKIDQ